MQHSGDVSSPATVPLDTFRAECLTSPKPSESEPGPESLEPQGWTVKSPGPLEVLESTQASELGFSLASVPFHLPTSVLESMPATAPESMSVPALGFM